MAARQTLQAVMDEDLRGLLASIGELEAVESGQRFCSVCNRPITLANLQVIVPLGDGGFRFVCNQPECVAASNERI
jgi:hypothetical protein